MELKLRFDAEERDREARRRQGEREWEYEVKREEEERLVRLKTVGTGNREEDLEAASIGNRDDLGQHWNDTLAGRTK